MKFLILGFVFFGGAAFAQMGPPSAIPSNASLGSEAADKWHFGVGLSYSLSSKLKSDNVSMTGVSGNMTADIDYDNVVSIEVDARRLSRRDWGFIAGLTYDSDRKVAGGSIAGGGVYSNLGSDTSKIQTTLIYAYAAYRWNEFYLPFGLNFSSIKYTPSWSYTGSSSASGGLGAQLGAGYYLTENFAVEAAARAVAVRISGTSAGMTTDYGNAMLTNFIVTGKYIF